MSSENVYNIGDRIRKYREDLGLSISDLAKRSGVSRPYIHLIENGQSNPSQDKLTSIAKALNVLVADLLGELVEETNSELPASLKAFAEEENIPYKDVLMLSKINYRGKQPESVQDWRLLYTVIKGTVEKE